jgi:hypothetical protein
MKNETPIDGVACTFTFDLYDVASGGTPLDTDSRSVEIGDGYFTVPLDFGSDAFTGEARWLEVAVQCPGDASSVALDDQRVSLTAAPYAHSVRPGAIVVGSATGAHAGQAVFNVQNDDPSPGRTAILGVSGSSAGGYPNEEAGVRGEAGDGYGVAGRSTSSVGVYGSSNSGYGVWGNSSSNFGVIGTSSTGYGVWANGGTGDLQLYNGAIHSTVSDGSDLTLHSNDHVDVHLDDNGSSTSQFRILNDADTVVFSVDESGTITGSISGGNGWSLTGNAGTDPSADFVGTTDNQALEFRVNDTRAMRLEPNPTSPNLISGHSGNSVNAGVQGATIGGGGRSGAPNWASGDYATVGGGGANLASASQATVSGGWYNAASQQGATVAGGSGNQAAGVGAVVSGGWENTGNGLYTAIGGGTHNVASGDYTTVGGGEYISVTGEAATVAGGSQITATGDYAAVGGGLGNVASGLAATVPGGAAAEAALYGQMAHASGAFSAIGDAQGSFYVLRGETTPGSPTAELFLDGSSQRLIVDNRTMTFDILVVARTAFPWSAGYTAQGVIEGWGGGAVGLLGSPVIAQLGDQIGGTSFAVSAEYGSLVLTASGPPDTTVRWVATVRTAEVGW